MRAERTPTILQIVASAYAWANGDLERGKILEPDQCTADDSFGEFLLAETDTMQWWYGRDKAPMENTPEHFDQAIKAMEQVVKEATTVRDALIAYRNGWRI